MKAGWESKYKLMRRNKRACDLRCRELGHENRALRMEVGALKNVCLQLWGEMGAPEIKNLRDDAPEVVAFLRALHQEIEHPESEQWCSICSRPGHEDEDHFVDRSPALRGE